MKLNLDFSGLFSPSNMKFDFSNLDMSGFNAKEPVSDPVDIVSNKTSAAKVNILEGAGDVEITKAPEVKYSPMVQQAITSTPDPIEQAIQSVKPSVNTPVDLGLDFSVKPTVTVNPISQNEISKVSSGFDVPTKAVESTMSDWERQQEAIKPLLQEAPNFNLNFYEFDGKRNFISKDTFDSINNFVNSSDFNSLLSQYSETMENTFGDDYDGVFQGVTDNRALLQSLGVKNAFHVQTDDLGSYDYMQFNSETGQFEKIEDLSYEVSKGNQTVAAVSQAVQMAALASMGAAALSSTSALSGLSGATQTAISRGVANGAITAAQGGDFKDVLQSATLAGLNGYADGITEAAEAANATKEVIAQAEVVNNIKDTVDIVKAVESGDVLGAISSTVKLADMGTPKDLVKGFIEDSLSETTSMPVLNELGDWAFNNADPLADAIVKVSDKMLQGEDLEDAVKSGVNEFVKEGGEFSDLIPEFEGGSLELPDFVQEITDVVAQGASFVNREIIQPVVDTVGVIGEGAIEAASQANQFVQREIIDEVETFLSEQNQVFQETLAPVKEDFSRLNQEVRQELANFDKENLQPIKENISQINKDVRAELAAFDDEKLQPIKQDIENVLNTVDQSLSNFNKDYIKPIDEKLSQTNKDVRDQLANFDKEFLQPIKQDLSNTNKTFQGEVDKIQEALSQTNRDFREELSGFEDTYLDPIKQDVKGLAGDLKEGLSSTNKAFQSEVDRLEEALSQTNKDFREGLSGFEDTYLDPLKQDVKGLAGDLKEGLSSTNEAFQSEVDRLEEALSQTNKDFREGLSGFEDDYLDPIKEDVEGLASDLKDGLSATNQYVRDQLSAFDDSVLQPVKNEIEEILGSIEGIDVDMSGVQNTLGQVWDALSGLGEGLAATQERVSRPDADLGALAKMRTQYGKRYQFEDITKNPLMENEFFS